MAFGTFRAGLLAGVALAALASPARADLNILYLSDMSGPTSVLTGISSQRAVEMAIADFGGEVNGEKIVLSVVDHQSKPDIGLGIARARVDGGKADLLFSLDQSAVALAVSDFIRDKNVTMIHGSSSSALTNEKCGPHQIQMLLDSYGLSRAITIPLVESGRKKWYYVTVDYAFGHDMQARGEDAIKQAGGQLVGASKFAPTTTDFSAFLLEAKSKGAESLGVAAFGTWQVAIAKQAQEFQLGIPLAPYFLGITDIKVAGLANFQNVRGAIQFYWDQNDKTRDFAKRYQQRYERPPTFTNAMHYEYVTHYLNALKAAGKKDAGAIVKRMRETPIAMINGDTATIRADGRTLRPMYTYATKTLQESKGDWDYLTITGKIEADRLAPPLSESKCPLVRS